MACFHFSIPLSINLLDIFISISQPKYVFSHLSIYISIYFIAFLSIYVIVSMYLSQFFYLSIYLSIYLTGVSSWFND